MFTFTRGSSASSSSYNPAVLATSANTQVGTYSTQMETLNYSFQNADTYMSLSNNERLALKNANRTASLGSAGVFSPLVTPSDNSGFWVKAYATFENVPLKNGPKVTNTGYGTIAGFDTNLQSIRHGFDRVFTCYLGYNGSSEHFSGVDTYQNGGLIGGTISLYKGKFFNATTISAGATVGDMSTMYGRDYFTSIVAGIGNKTGYNIEFKNGRFIIQPNILLAYTMIKTMDYTNSAGVRINSDPMSAIQVAPGIKFIGNTKTGWQPYLAVNMVWNILAHSQVTANNVNLPDMSIKPYVQYGLGLQRKFGDRFFAFGQALIQNGGRNGISITLGLRWSVGK
jgi:outer membrane autotransporter protein